MSKLEKQLLAAMLLHPDDLYSPEHQMIFRAIIHLFAKGTPIDLLSVDKELHNEPLKEKANLRKPILTSKILHQEAAQAFLPANDIISKAQITFDQICLDSTPSSKSAFTDFFSNQFQDEVANPKKYATRRSGFDNPERIGKIRFETK